MKSISPFLLIAIVVLSCANGVKNDQKSSQSISDTNSTTYVYRYKDKFLNLSTLKIQDAIGKGQKEVKRAENYADGFNFNKNDKIALYHGLTFTLNDKNEVCISDSTGKTIKTVPAFDSKNTLDNIVGNAVLFSIPTGVVAVLRMADEKGYRISKFDENGKLLNHWEVPHTIYKKYDNTIESIPSLYYFAHSDNEAIFSTMHYSEKDETVVLNLTNGEVKRTDKTAAGIITDKDLKLDGFVYNIYKSKIMKVELGGHNWDIQNDYSNDAARTVLAENLLIIATFDRISSGSNVNAYNAQTGKLIWQGDVKQLQVAHSEYYNAVFLTLFEDKLILEGNEAGGNYLQVLDLKSGKNLFAMME